MEEQKKVLIIDDDPQFLKSMAEYLEGYYNVGLAKSGEAALRRLKQGNHPDLILLDIEMPGIDGHEVMEHLKKAPETNQIPVVYLTGLSEEEHEAKGLNNGALDYLKKPVSQTILLIRLERYLNIDQAMRRGELDEKKLISLARPLTRRQLDTARLLAEFKSNEQIAKELEISLTRAKQLVSEVMDKLGIEKRDDIRIFIR